MSYLLTLSKSLSIDAYKKINFLVAGVRGSGKTYGTLILIAELASFPGLALVNFLAPCNCRLKFIA